MFEINKMPESIDIGIAGETNFRTIPIDMTPWMKDTPDGVPSIIHIRPGETEENAYIAATTFDRETNVLTWLITAGDLGVIDGEGIARIWLEKLDSDDEVVKRGKSLKVKTIVHGDETLDPTDEPPAAQAAWLEQMTALKDATVEAAEDAQAAKEDAEEAKDAAEDAQTAAETAKTNAEAAETAAKAAQTAAETAITHYPKIENGNWYVWNPSTQQWVNTGIAAEGQDGFSPVVTVTAITGGHRVTIQDATQTQTVDIMDGEVSEAELEEATTELKSQIDGKADLIRDTVQNVAIASVPDGAANLPLTALRFAVEPIQAGNGDPYPAGGGKNKFNPNSTANEWVETNKTLSTRSGAKSVRVACSEGDTFTLSQKNESSSRNVMLISYLDSSDNVLTRNVKANGDKVLTVTAPADASVCLASFIVWDETEEQQLEKASSASTYAPYSNIRPITGRTGAVVSNAPIYGLGTMLQYGLGDDGAVNSYAYYEHSEYIDLTGINTASIAFTGGASGGWTYRVCGYNASKTFVDLIDKQALRASDYSFTYDVTNYAYLRVSLVSGCENIVFHAGTQTHTVQFGQTVYGCLADYVNGKAYVTYVLAVFDGSNDENWNFSTSNSKNRVYTTDLVSTIDNTGDVYANYLKAYQNASYPDEWNYQKATASFIIGVPSEINSKDAWKTYLASNNLQICYKLAEPIEISLSELDEIRTVEGQNNVWADCGDIVLLEYGCDTKGYIDKKLAELTALVLET